MSSSKIPPIEQLSSETEDLFELLNHEPDLAVILVSSSFLDASLRSILERRLKESFVTLKILDPKGGALSTFSARADVCYALGLISKPLYKDLLTIMDIRNSIAHHHLALSFKSEELQKKCSDLKYVKSLIPEESPTNFQDYLIGARNQFVVTVVLISQRLLIVGLGTKYEK